MLRTPRFATLALAAWSAIAVGAGCATAPSTPPAPPAPAGPTEPSTQAINVVGVLAGEPVVFACQRPPAELGAKNSAVRAGPLLFLSCTDAQSGVQVNATVPLVVGTSVPNVDESNGRIGLVVPAADENDAPLDIITTSSRSRESATVGTGEITVVHALPDGRAVGFATLNWKKDIRGQEGYVTVDFDLVVP